MSNDDQPRRKNVGLPGNGGQWAPAEHGQGDLVELPDGETLREYREGGIQYYPTHMEDYDRLYRATLLTSLMQLLRQSLNNVYFDLPDKQAYAEARNALETLNNAIEKLWGQLHDAATEIFD